MDEKEALHGLNCPNCGGVVPVPEGQVIVRCPYCDLRSFVKGERGLRRFQVPLRAPRETALDSLRRFLAGNWAIARDTGRKSEVIEALQVYLPFWTVWGRLAAWVFGEKRVGSGDHKRYEPREVRIVQEMTWNGAACDVGEFGVTQVPLTNQELEPFNPEALHAAGMVFEPVGSFVEARQTAEKQFNDQARRKAGLDRVSQFFVRFLRQRSALVYYPLWVLRYLYRGRVFQVVVDAYSGQVLYGKAPGNTLYRAGILVAGMALGAFLAVNSAVLGISLFNGDEDNPSVLLFILALVGVGIMFGAYRAFRYGEEYEYRSAGGKKGISLPGGLDSSLKDFGSGLSSLKVKDIEEWIDRFS